MDHTLRFKVGAVGFVRPGEPHAAQWAEFDFEKAEWRIPAARMTMRVQHVVPLSTQAIAVLRDLQELTGRFALAFPGVRSRFRPMSENTVTAALRRMGYSGQDMTGHGFLSMASTLLNEQGWNRDAVRAAYNYAQHLPERRSIIQAWADFLDRLKADVAAPKPMPAILK